MDQMTNRKRPTAVIAARACDRRSQPGHTPLKGSRDIDPALFATGAVPGPHRQRHHYR